MIASLKSGTKKYGYTWKTRPFELNIIGVRKDSATSNVTEPNSFDDSLWVIYTDDKGKEVSMLYQVTTDPGTYYLLNPMQPDGTAILAPGSYPVYEIGLHQGKYKALVQRGPVTVYRDNNKDNNLDLDPRTTKRGVFGINIHKAGVSTIKVDKWSAGCTVFAKEADFNNFMKLCDKHSKLYGNKFTYNLLEYNDLNSFI
jgi:hypothetical protein